MNKKVYIVTMMAILGVLYIGGLTGCANRPSKGKEENLYVKEDYFDEEDFYNGEKGDKEKRITLTQECVMVIEEYTREEMVEEADLIIRGETIDYKSYMDSPGNIWTTESVRVYECIKGDVAVGEVIEIDKMGGCVLIEDFLNSFDGVGKEGIREKIFSGYTEEQMSTEYIEQITGGFRSELRKKAMYYLLDNGDEPYIRVAGQQSEFAEKEENISHKDNNDIQEEID